MVAASGLDWTTIRLPAIMATDTSWGNHPAFIRYGFLLSLDHKMHTLDSRDAALGLTNAIAADTKERYFVLGGPEDCKMTSQAYLDTVLESRGMRPFPRSAYRKADKNVDASWVAEDFIDTTESQTVLKYQQHSFRDHLDYMATQTRLTKYLLKVIGPLVQRQLLKESETVNQPIQVNSRPLWDVVCERFAIPQQYR